MMTARILIVEEEISIARQTEVMLSQLGYNVTGIASDTDLALQSIATTPPDLVLMDTVVQGQDGVATAMQIRDRFQIPVVYLTADADDRTIERAKHTYPLGYILKPVKQRDLRVAIELALFQHRSTAQPQPEPTNSLLQPEGLSMLSHELRNPLLAIKFAATLLAESNPQMSEQMRSRNLQRIQLAANNMNQLLEDVLMLGLTESDQAQLTPKCIDVAKFCQELIEALQWNVTGKHTLRFIDESNQCRAEVDEKLLSHLLNNLLLNAIKYSPTGGTVTLTLFPYEGALRFKVEDQGIGIPVEEQANLFKAFQRGSNVGKISGTGLGLAIVQRVIDLHNGEISVESEVGKGTVFTVSLPVLNGNCE